MKPKIIKTPYYIEQRRRQDIQTIKDIASGTVFLASVAAFVGLIYISYPAAGSPRNTLEGSALPYVGQLDDTFDFYPPEEESAVVPVPKKKPCIHTGEGYTEPCRVEMTNLIKTVLKGE